MQTETAHILFIDDKANAINEAKESLGKDFGYQNLETAMSAAEALEKLQEPYDVIIADMRMEEDNSGFTILEYVRSQNIASVVIILTANDTVRDCRAAFKREAWDYISKNMRGDVFEAVHESIQEAMIYLNRWGNRHNEQWLIENQAKLEQEHWGRHVAIINRDVIESADTEAELEQRLTALKLRRLTTTVKKIGDLKPISELIQADESEVVEFKRSLQWDQEKNKKTKNQQQKTLKAIASFLNSEGGTLIIGVEDDLDTEKGRKIYGLEQDYLFLQQPTQDKLRLHLVNLISDNIGKQFMPHIKIAFDTFDGKDVCAVYVKKAQRLAFVRENKQLALYIRAGNSSRAVSIEEIYSYVK